MRYRIIFTLAVAAAALDQFSKWAVVSWLGGVESVRVTSFFNVVYVRNYGAAFGFLNDPSSEWQFWLFAAATVLAAGVVLYVAKSAEEKDRLLFFGLGCVLGGAVGNFIDRVRFRAVVDFLDFHVAGYHWPAFNVADICICLGAFATALCILRPASRTKGKR